MLQIKDNQILKNITLFNKNESIPILGLVSFLKGLNLKKYFNTPNQAFYHRSYSFVNLILIYFLGVKNIHQLMNSNFSKWIENGKDVFYRICSDHFINWRQILYKINKRILTQTHIEQSDKATPSCFIIDDTDIEKRGRKIEFIGYVWSHVINKSILGFKSLNLCYWSNNTLLALDFSLHLEMGKNKSKPQGMKAKHLKERFTKQRTDKCPGLDRVKELTVSKIDNAIKMIKRALKNGIVARYVLMDSWFCCEKIIGFVASIPKMDLICRAKMGNSKYTVNEKEYSAKQLLNKFKYRRDVRKKSRKLKTNYLVIKATYKGVPVKLIFLKIGRNKWILFLSTDMRASVLFIIETYQIRWTIEVFYKQTKQQLGLGKCQANDFDAQIANTTCAILRYNILSTIKSKSEHFSIGTLFRSINQSLPNPNIVDMIIKLFNKIIMICSELLDINFEFILQKVFTNENLSDFDRNLLTVFCNEETCET